MDRLTTMKRKKEKKKRRRRKKMALSKLTPSDVSLVSHS
jgi:hypothetical protein